jgi:hypothetical protein
LQLRLTHRGTAAPPVLLVDNIVLFRIEGCGGARNPRRKSFADQDLLTFGTNVNLPLWIFGEYISQNNSHSQGPKSEFKEVTAAHVGCHC